MNSLLAAKHYELDITILLMNNNGGGIFSFLPQAKEAKHFEALFGTPLHIDFKHAAEMYGATYYNVQDKEELSQVTAQTNNQPGIKIIEVKTDQNKNVQ